MVNVELFQDFRQFAAASQALGTVEGAGTRHIAIPDRRKEISMALCRKRRRRSEVQGDLAHPACLFLELPHHLGKPRALGKRDELGMEQFIRSCPRRAIVRPQRVFETDDGRLELA